MKHAENSSTYKETSDQQGISSSTAASNEETWIDITETFTSSAQELGVGELVHGKKFGLECAMNAMEIMDPKMDPNCESKRAQRQIRSFQQLLDAGLIKVKDFSSEELLGIMDELLACLATWLEGQCLAQTVFTCVYTHDVTAIEDRVLKAFCVGIIKMCGFLRDVIFRGGVHEDEDQQTMTFGFNLLGKDVTDQKAASMMKEAEDVISKSIRVLNASVKKGAGGDSQVDITDSNYLLRCSNAVLSRIRFCKAFLIMCVNLDKLQCSGLDVAREQTATALKLLPELRQTIKLGIKREGEGVNALMLGFEPLINQRLLPASPRPPAVMTREQASDYLNQSLCEMQQVYTIADLTSLSAIQGSCSRFSWQLPFPTLMSRSYLICLFWEREKVFGKFNVDDLIREAVQMFTSPPSLCPKSKLAASQSVKEISDEFVFGCAQPMLDLFQAQFYHRSKHRQKYSNVFKKLATVQGDAGKLDNVLHNVYKSGEPEFNHINCFSAWLLHIILHSLLEYVMLGLENELYATHELHYVFVYVEYLLGWLGACLVQSDKIRQQTDAQVAKQQSKAKGKKKKEQKKKASEIAARGRGREHELLFVQAQQCLVRGLLKIIEGLWSEGHLAQPSFEFGSEKSRYEHRFKALTVFETPGPLPYEQYRSQILSISESSPLYEEAMQQFNKSRQILENAPVSDEQQVVLKVVKTNLVVARLLASGHKKNQKTEVSFDFSTHRYYPIVRVS